MTRRIVRTEAAGAAVKVLQDRIDLASDLAEAGAAIDAVEEELRAVMDKLAARRAAYSESYRAAVAGGWTDDELTQIGCPASRGDAPLPGAARAGNAAPKRREAHEQPRQSAPSDEHVRSRGLRSSTTQLVSARRAEAVATQHAATDILSGRQAPHIRENR